MIRTRFHGTYAEYLAKQAYKTANADFRSEIEAKRSERVLWFRDRFAALRERRGGKALCLGARYGEEVEALRGLGWRATGVDLVAYPPWVEQGDMNNPPAEKYDLVYTNAFDHCWNPGQFIANSLYALNRGGSLVLHIASGPPGEYETVEWDSVEDVANLIRAAGVVTFVGHFAEFYGLDTAIVGVVL